MFPNIADILSANLTKKSPQLLRMQHTNRHHHDLWARKPNDTKTSLWIICYHTHKQTKIEASKAKVNELDAKFLTVHKQNDYDIIIKT